jgi:hypothetical protein
MKQDEILEALHKVVQEHKHYTTWTVSTPHLVALVKLAIEHEREACAKLEIELILSPAFFATMGEYDAHKDAVLAYRNLIRARGQA